MHEEIERARGAAGSMRLAKVDASVIMRVPFSRRLFRASIKTVEPGLRRGGV